MPDPRIVDFVKPRWCTIRLATAHDQYLLITPGFGTFAAYRENNPAANKWFHFLIIPRNVGSGQFWLFSKAAQSGIGALVTAPDGDGNLRGWQLTQFPNDELWQCFDITPLPSYDQDRKVRLRCVEDDRVVSTRWDRQAFLSDLTEGDDQQMLHLGDAGPIPMPTVPGIEGTSGSMDRDLLKVEGFNETEVVEATPPRVVSTQLIPFPLVHDTYTLGRRMRETPYYLLTRRCFWKKVKSHEFPAAGKKEQELTWEIGFKKKETSELEQRLKITVGAKMSYKAVVGIGGELSFAVEHGERWTRRSEVERYETETGRYKVNYEDGDHVLVVVWALVNRYTLTRTNGEAIGEVEFIEKDDSIARSYLERESGVGCP